MRKGRRLIAGFEGEMFGFLEAVGAAPDQVGTRLRSHLVFDAILTKIGPNGAINESDSELAIIRVMSTMNRLANRFAAALKEGEWYRLTFASQADEPIAWILPTADGSFQPVTRTNLTGLERLGSVPGQDADRLALEAFCAVGSGSQSSAAVRPYTTGQGKDPSLHVRMVDVGQASFCALHVQQDEDSAIVGYYDVGGPIFFHHKSFPPKFDEKRRVPLNGFVALSHWDFDHYSLAFTSLKGLQLLDWYAPDQKVGPYAAKFQKQLGTRLTLLAAPHFELAPGLSLRRGTGTSDDRNGSGYVLLHERQDGKVLLTGDVPYNCIPSDAVNDLTALAITHHGGKSGDLPPSPTIKGAMAAVSFGIPNYYHHPNDAFLDAHVAAGWTVERTRLDKHVRNDIWIA